MRAVIPIFFPLFLLAQIHYAKLEPVESYVVKAAAAGQVMMADESAEGRVGDGKIVVQIDDRVDRAQKRALEVTLEALKSTLKLTREMAENQQKVYEKDYRYYLRTKGMKTKSQTEKDRIFSTMMASRNQLLSLKEKIATLKKQIADTDYQRVMLEDRIAKKAVRAKGLYIYRVAVRKGDYVNPGALLLKAMDTSRGRLVVFLDADEMENLDRKKIYLDGKETDLRFDKVIRVADDVHISSYRAEIVLDRPVGLFSRLVKIEIK
jgi:flagellar motor protein MotB